MGGTQITEAFPWDEAPRYLIRDRDRIYGSVVTRRLRAMGIRDKPIAPASPWQNGVAERLIGSIRRECVDHIIVLGETHLRRILKSYARYYNETSERIGLEQGCAPIAHRKKGRAYSLPPSPRRIASRICPDLISDRHKDFFSHLDRRPIEQICRRHNPNNYRRAIRRPASRDRSYNPLS